MREGINNGSTYYMNSDEISYASKQYDNSLYESYVNNNSTLNAMESFITDSTNFLVGDTWDAIRSDLSTYEEFAKMSDDLNKYINETQQKCLARVQEFLSPDMDLNTADLPALVDKKDMLEYSIAVLEAQNEKLSQVPESICVGYDKETGLPIYKHNPAYDAAQAQIAANNAKISNELQPALNETNRLINKINEFMNEVLPQIERELDEVKDRVDRFINDIDGLDTSNLGIYKLYLAREFKGEDEVTILYDENGKPYAIEYKDSHIYADYSDPNYPKFTRYDPETGEYRPISIFDIENILSRQYGADQVAFQFYFEDLIKDPVIWEEMQKYFPVDNFQGIDDAMDFYENYFQLVANTGCGYAAEANIIFDIFKGKEQEFQDKFGFPMYSVDDDGNVDFNYEAMTIKLYNDKFFNPEHYDTEDEIPNIHQLVAGYDTKNTNSYMPTYRKNIDPLGSLGTNIGDIKNDIENGDIDTAIEDYIYLRDSINEYNPQVLSKYGINVNYTSNIVENVRGILNEYPNADALTKDNLDSIVSSLSKIDTGELDSYLGTENTRVYNNRPIGPAANLDIDLSRFLQNNDIGVKCNVTNLGGLPSDNAINMEIKDAFENNDYVVYAGAQYDLTNEQLPNGGYYNGGSHYMMITGFSNDENPIATSWGLDCILDAHGESYDESKGGYGQIYTVNMKN